MRERYSFRFTHDEIAEMQRVLERQGSRPLQTQMEELALSFSKGRQEQGLTCVRVESIQSWFKRHRGGYTKSKIGEPRAKSAKSWTSILAARPSSFTNDKHVAEDETSERSNSDEGRSEDESESMDSEENGIEPNAQYHNVSNSVDCMGVSFQPIAPPQGPVTETDGVTGRLAGYKNGRSEAKPKSILSKCTDLSTLSKIGEARATLEKVKGLSLVDFRNHKENLRTAVKVLLEEGDALLSKAERTELPLLVEKLHKISQENDRVRTELADCRAFLEKVVECEENAAKLMEKARIMEEKYNAFTHNILTLSNKKDELEAAIHHAKAEVEKMKGDKEDIAAQLVRIAQSLQSASTHQKILKAEESAVIQKRNHLMESLRKNAEEWVKVTDSRPSISSMMDRGMCEIGRNMQRLELLAHLLDCELVLDLEACDD